MLSSVMQPPPPPACTGGTLYTVATGDTLQSIAASFSITLDMLVEANPQLIALGQVLCVPVAPSTCSLILVPTASAPGTTGVMLVQPRSPSGVNVLVAALNLPAPSTFGAFDTYFTRIVSPSGTSVTFPLTLVPGTPIVYAGGFSSTTTGLTPNSNILVFPGTSAGAVGPVVLQGNLADCH